MKRRATTIIIDPVALNDCPCEGGQQSGEAPSEFGLLPVGQPVVCTINGTQHKFTITPEEAKNIVAKNDDRNRDVTVDYDHSTLDKEMSATGNAPAAGWMKKIIYDPDKQLLIAQMRDWQPKAKEQIRNQDYKYFSPVLLFDKTTGRPDTIHSVALTNHPAVHGAPPILAANDLSLDTVAGMDTTVLAANDMTKTEANETYASLASALRDINSASNDSQKVLEGTLKAMSDFVAGCPELEKKHQELTNELFVDSLPMSDGIDHLMEHSNKLKDAEAKHSFLTSALNGLNPKTPEAAKLHAEIKKLNFKPSPAHQIGSSEASSSGSSGPSDTEKQIASSVGQQPPSRPAGEAQAPISVAGNSQANRVSVSPAQVAQPALHNDTGADEGASNLSQVLAGGSAMSGGLPMTDMLAMSDISPMIGLTGKADRQRIFDRIVMMNDIWISTAKYLGSEGETSFDGVKNKYSGMLAMKDTRIGELESVAKQAKVDAVVNEAVKDGKIMEHEIGKYTKLAMKDLDMFVDLMDSRQQIFDKSIVKGMAMADTGVAAAVNPQYVSGKHHTHAEGEVWTAMGSDPEEMAQRAYPERFK
jgi:phage I-like protein